MKQTAITEITLEHNPSQAKLDEMKVAKWSVWKKEVSTFEWTFPKQEIENPLF